MIKNTVEKMDIDKRNSALDLEQEKGYKGFTIG